MLPEFDARYLAFSVIIVKCFKALNAIYLKTLSAKKGPTHAYLSVYWKCQYTVKVKVALTANYIYSRLFLRIFKGRQEDPDVYFYSWARS